MRTGNEIRQLRKKLRLSQEGLSSLIGVSRSAVYDWEREAYSPEGENLVNLAKALEVSVAYLIGETGDPSPQTVTPDIFSPRIAQNEKISSGNSSQANREIIGGMALDTLALHLRDRIREENERMDDDVRDVVHKALHDSLRVLEDFEEKLKNKSA